MSKYTIQLEEDGYGNLIIPFTAELLEEVGWKEGDTLEWTDNKDGSFMITKQIETETEWVLVETISQFRQRYVVEVPKGKSEYALDSVTTEDVKEFSQKHLGETVVSHRVISEKDALDLFDKDNDYLQGWTDEQKMQTGFTSAGYSKEEE
jgi:bifunctional DNA-binding transcriptional regulator/antitoxin component of YhaV-PrlF toxin-antitoxin module